MTKAQAIGAPAAFRIPRRIGMQRLRKSLCRSLGLEADSHQRFARSYYDTFDWRVYRNSWTLEFEAGPVPRLALRELLTGRVRRACEASDMPRFANDLPAGPFRDELENVLSVRALLPLLTLQIDAHPLHRVDAEGKTVLRVVLETVRWPPGASDGSACAAKQLVLQPVKGYEKVARKARQHIAGELGLEPAGAPPFVAALQAAGSVPGRHSNKLRLHLDPDMRTDAALRIGLLELLAMMERNVDGIREEIDAVFLHDFRIAVRRSRAVLGQVKAVVPKGVRERFGRELRWLGQITGPARDLDVYLQDLREYQSQLSGDSRDALTPLRDFLVTHRHTEYATLAHRLEFRRWLRFKAAWREYLESPALARTRLTNAARPVKRVADERILRAYKRVRKDGRSIKRKTPVAALHDLRIDCKKLRYLLELFCSLYSQRPIKKSIRALKGLQENLGELHDYAVQAECLSVFAQEMAEEGAVPPRTLAAMEAMARMLHQREQRARAEFARRFAEFDARPHRALFKSFLLRSMTGGQATNEHPRHV